jgi:hypothetical protein
MVGGWSILFLLLLVIYETLASMSPDSGNGDLGKMIYLKSDSCFELWVFAYLKMTSLQSLDHM